MSSPCNPTRCHASHSARLRQALLACTALTLLAQAMPAWSQARDRIESGASFRQGGQFAELTTAGGTFAITDSNSLGANPVTVTAPTTFRFDGGFVIVPNDFILQARATYDTNGNVGVLDGGITGNDGLVKTGDGLLVLNRNNTSFGTNYTGPTIIQQGALALGQSDAASPNSAFIIEAGAFLDTDNDSGGLTNTIGSLSGAGAVRTFSIGDVLRVGADNSSTTFSGRFLDLSGLGGLLLEKIGAGVLTLDNADAGALGGLVVQAGQLHIASGGSIRIDPSSGVQAVSRGELRVDGQLGSAGGDLLISASSGGVISGTGTIQGIVFNQGGVVAPGNSPGRLTILGDYIVINGSGAVTRIAAAAPDQVAQLLIRPDSTGAGGMASLGGELRIVPSAGVYLPGSHVILDAVSFGPAGLGDRFESVSGLSSAFVTFSVVYDDANADVILNVTPVTTPEPEPGPGPGPGPGPAPTPGEGDGPFGAACRRIGGTYNQCQASLSADAFAGRQAAGILSSDGQVVLGNLLSLNLRGFRRAMDSISGQLHPLVPTVLRGAQDRFSGFIGDRLASGGGNASLDTSGLRYGWGSAAAQEAAMHLDAGPGESKGLGADQAAKGWIKGYGTFGALANDRNAAGADYRIGGFAGGLERQTDADQVIGAAVGYANTDAKARRQIGSFDADTFQFAVYGQQRWNAYFLNGQVGGAVHDVETRRRIRFASIDRQAFSDHQDYSFHARLEGGRRFTAGGFDVTPALGLRYNLTSQENFRETGAGALNLRVYENNDDSLQIRPSLSIGREMRLGALPVRADLSAGYAREFIDSTQSLSVQHFEEPEVSPHRVRGPRQDRDLALVGLNLAAQTSDAVSFFIRYDGAFSASGRANGIAGGLKIAW